jgi:hypothetical protein
MDRGGKQPETAMDPDSAKKSRYGTPPDCPKCDLMKSQVSLRAAAALGAESPGVPGELQCRSRSRSRAGCCAHGRNGRPAAAALDSPARPPPSTIPGSHPHPHPAPRPCPHLPHAPR